MRHSQFLIAAAGVVVASLSFQATEPIRYRFSFPEPEHRWMQVEATFPDLPAGTVEFRMSRSSPGRYALHDFAKNVYDVRAFGRDQHELPASRPDPYGWNVGNHGGRVTLTYKVFGDVVDGTYLAIDPTHAHINMPAALMWARGLDDRPSTLTFTPPADRRWQIATQLHPGSTPFEFTAPNLQYLMDSPVEFGPLSVRSFSVGPRQFRYAVHHLGSDAELDEYLKDVEKIVREEGAVFGEFPEYEPGYYTFLADYLPYASGDGMEHRNSTVMTANGSIRTTRQDLLGTVAHEFFHGWNVERIRPRSLEPFDFERANISGELWLAEGFTEYYGRLTLRRAGIDNDRTLAASATEFVETMTASPGHAVRSAEDMSRLAPFTDGGSGTDRNNWHNTYVSYYPLGGAIALALDLTLRDRSNGAVTLDDYMRAMWRVHGKPGGSREGYVDRPYSMADAEARLADVSGDRAFARDFFSKYIQGRDTPNYAALLQRAGFVVRKRHAGRAWWGDVRIEPSGSRMTITAPSPAGSPAYAAGLDRDVELRRMDGERLRANDDVAAILQRHKPGDRVIVLYVDRTGVEKTTTVTLAEDPHVEVVPIEATGQTLTAAQGTFRAGWLGAR